MVMMEKEKLKILGKQKRNVDIRKKNGREE